MDGRCKCVPLRTWVLVVLLRPIVKFHFSGVYIRSTLPPHCSDTCCQTITTATRISVLHDASTRSLVNKGKHCSINLCHNAHGFCRKMILTKLNKCILFTICQCVTCTHMTHMLAWNEKPNILHKVVDSNRRTCTVDICALGKHVHSIPPGNVIWSFSVVHPFGTRMYSLRR